MELPFFLPKSLESYGTLLSDKELFDQLKSKREDLVHFFCSALEDEAWCNNHPLFIKNALNYFSHIAFKNELELNFAEELQKKIEEYHQLLAPYLSLDLLVEVEEESFFCNSLLFINSSPIFKEAVRNQRLNQNSKKVVLNDLSKEIFEVFQEFIQTGTVLDLWKKDEAFLRRVTLKARLFGLLDLSLLSEIILKLYLTRENVLDVLIDSYQNGLTFLNESSIDFINDLDLGVKFHKIKEPFFYFEFLAFDERAFMIFNQVKKFITHLKVVTLIDKKDFPLAASLCPRLKHISISEAPYYSDNILDLPKNLSELDISSCSWLKGDYFSKIVTQFPNLKALNISDNIELRYNSLGLIGNLKNLRNLAISKNPQVGDEELKIILQAIPSLYDFDCSDCKNIGETGFFELSNNLTRLNFLNLSNCELTDVNLLNIGLNCLDLEEINLTGCSNLTDRGVVEFVQVTKSLKRMNLSKVGVREMTAEEIKRQRPYLKILFH